jgi:hypothetical protein
MSVRGARLKRVSYKLRLAGPQTSSAWVGRAQWRHCAVIDVCTAQGGDNGLVQCVLKAIRNFAMIRLREVSVVARCAD